MGFEVSANDVQTLYTGIQLSLRDAYNKYMPKMSGLAMQVVSSQMREAYPLQAINATMTRWTGDRSISNLIQKTVYLDNGKPWQETIGISRQDLELKGRTLNMGSIAAKQGKAAKALEDQIIKTLLQNGASQVCVDGVNFFSASHPVIPWESGAGTFTNYRTSFGLTRANFRTAYQYMRALKGWDTLPFDSGDYQYILLVPPQLESIAQTIVEADLVANDGTAGGTSVASQNVDKGKAKVVVSPLLIAEADVWYLISLDPSMGASSSEFGVSAPLAGPFVLQQWRPLEVTPMFNLTDPNVFFQDQYLIGINRGLEGGYLLPQHALRCEG